MAYEWVRLFLRPGRPGVPNVVVFADGVWVDGVWVTPLQYRIAYGGKNKGRPRRETRLPALSIADVPTLAGGGGS
jgi:hypothetical protein